MPDIANEIEAYAAYRNAHARAQSELRHEELVEFEADMAKAQRAMELAWLELVPCAS